MTARALPLTIGALLAGKYRIDALLGQGGMGAVFAAENLDLGRAVAIKVLYGELARDESLVKRFRQEARAAAAIGHPGIVDVLDLGTTDDGDPFIVMERLDGEALGTRFTRQGRMPIAAAAAILAEALEALAAAHAKGIVHRDLKPDNVFLVARPTPAVKLVDFGISKFQGAEDVGLTTTGAVMGTPLYMSPEQGRGARDIGQATDLYSMGAILYQALCGYPPLNGTSYNELIAKLITEDPLPLQSRRAALPAALARLVHEMLAKDPQARPSARDAAEQLRAMAAELGAVVEAAIGYGPTLPPDAPTAPGNAMAATVAAATPATAVAFGATIASQPPTVRPASMAETVAAPVAAPVATPAPVATAAPRRNPALLLGGAAVALLAIIAIILVVTRRSDAPRAAPVLTPPDAGVAARIAPDAAATPVDATPATDAATPASAPDARPGGRTPKRRIDAGVAGSGSGTGTGTDDGLTIDTDNPLGPPKP